MSTFVDFAELKCRVSIHMVMQMLGLTLHQHGSQFRGSCPVHGGGDRTLVITPGKGFFCFVEKQGGDQIQLVSHVRRCSAKEAADAIAAHFGTIQVPPHRNSTSSQGTVPPAPQTRTGLAAVADYLQPAHEAVQALGVSEETAAAFGSGYAPRGIMRGRYAVPIKSKDGTLLAYVGVAVSQEQSPKLLFPNGFDPHSVIFGADRAQSGELYLVRDPLQVLIAFESGVENVVAFLTNGISAQQLEMLASMMDEKKCENVELF